MRSSEARVGTSDNATVPASAGADPANTAFKRPFIDELDTALARIAYRAVGARDADKLRSLANAVPDYQLPDRIIAAAKLFAHVLLVALDPSADSTTLHAKTAAHLHTSLLTPQRLDDVEGKDRYNEVFVQPPESAARPSNGMSAVDLPNSYHDRCTEPLQGRSNHQKIAVAPSTPRRSSFASSGTDSTSSTKEARPTRRRSSTFLRRKRDKAIPADYKNFRDKTNAAAADALGDAIQESMRELQLVACAFADMVVIRRTAVADICSDIIQKSIAPLTDIEKRFSQGIFEAVARSHSIAKRVSQLSSERVAQSAIKSEQRRNRAVELDQITTNALSITEKLASAACEAMFESQQALQILTARAARGSFAAVIAAGHTRQRLDTRPLLPQRNLKAYRLSAMLNKIDCRSAELQGIVCAYKEDIDALVEAAQKRKQFHVHFQVDPEYVLV